MIPAPRHWRQARDLVEISTREDLAAVPDHVYLLSADPEELGVIVFCLCRMIQDVNPPPAANHPGRPQLPDRIPYTVEEARAAHAARFRGDDSQWARDGERAYQRQRKRAQRAPARRY